MLVFGLWSAQQMREMSSGKGAEESNHIGLPCDCHKTAIHALLCIVLSIYLFDRGHNYAPEKLTLL